MPRWVPVLIGVVLVALAGLAVFTGLRYRRDTLADHLGTPSKKQPGQTSAAPPGEPGAGSSLVLHENTPAANAPIASDARAAISGGGSGGVQSTVRIWARRGMVLNVLPDDALVYVNDTPIGDVRQFNSMDEAFEFAEPGSYTIKISADGHRTRQYVVTIADNAPNDVARISAKLDRE
jgi:hypothetical protein